MNRNSDESATSSETSKAPKAVALFYDGIRAPELSAVGTHAVAERIIAEAKKHRIPVYENPELVELLSRQRQGELIPPELYQVVAEIIAFIYHLEGRYPRDWPVP